MLKKIVLKFWGADSEGFIAHEKRERRRRTSISKEEDE